MNYKPSESFRMRCNRNAQKKAGTYEPDAVMSYSKKRKKEFDHEHKETSDFSPQQQAMFFALANQLGLSVQEVKERAKKRFKLKCFNDIKKPQLTWLIDKLVAKQEQKKKS